MNEIACILAAARLTEISLEGVLLLVFNGLLAFAVGFIIWSYGRMWRQNDERHKDTDRRIDRVLEAIRSESDNRHESYQHLDNRIWQQGMVMAEDYPKRTESMKLYGTLMCQINDNHRETTAKLDALPCTGPACPGDKGEKR